MMRFMGKLPGTLEAMKPMFPILFPRLLPRMMHKVMPTLMLQVMDNLMPHMIRDVVPLVTQPMIDYLRGKNGHWTVMKQRGDPKGSPLLRGQSACGV